MIRNFRRIFLSIFILCFLSHTGFAYNFLYVEDEAGIPVGWEPGSTITYYLDPGILPDLTNEQLHQLLQIAMRQWESVSPQVPRFMN